MLDVIEQRSQSNQFNIQNHLNHNRTLPAGSARGIRVLQDVLTFSA
jgi:hypothetical protein